MFEIDKQKLGAFIAALRREKGYTQKELAEKLFISDKAVSKWETGASIPDTALFIPLAELFGISVTELFLCERMEAKENWQPDTVEALVRTAVASAKQPPTRAYQFKSNWFFLYALFLCLGLAGILLNIMEHTACLGTLLMLVLLCAGFGAYFCFFVPVRLPDYYDENRVDVFCDGPFRIHMPGVRFHNGNWPHIIRTLRVCTNLSMLLFPLCAFFAESFLPPDSGKWSSLLLLVIFLCVFFLPVYIAAKNRTRSKHNFFSTRYQSSQSL